jgi:hypothetical protein
MSTALSMEGVKVIAENREIVEDEPLTKLIKFDVFYKDGEVIIQIINNLLENKNKPLKPLF